MQPRPLLHDTIEHAWTRTIARPGWNARYVHRPARNGAVIRYAVDQQHPFSGGRDGLRKRDGERRCTFARHRGRDAYGPHIPCSDASSMVADRRRSSWCSNAYERRAIRSSATMPLSSWRRMMPRHSIPRAYSTCPALRIVSFIASRRMASAAPTQRPSNAAPIAINTAGGPSGLIGGCASETRNALGPRL